MLRIDQQITNTSNIIYRNIKSIPNESRGAASQDILAQIRNLTDAIMVKCMAKDNNEIDPVFCQKKHTKSCKIRKKCTKNEMVSWIS